MRVSRQLLLASLLSAASLPALACYTVYDRDNRILYQSDRPPVDMSRPLHETLPQRFPGGQLVFDLSAECPVISPVAIGDGGPSTRTSSPLLTDERTAKAIGAPHRTVNGVAVIAPSEVQMKPGVTVIPATSVASKSPSGTAVLGGPAVTRDLAR
jgi:hypothetical protein